MILRKIFLAGFWLWILTSCTTQRHLPQVVTLETTRRDTCYIHDTEYDSIYIFHSTDKDYRRGNLTYGPSEYLPNQEPSETSGTLKPFGTLVDTIIVSDVTTEYRYKLLRDTVRELHVDTIPVIREVEVTKTVRYTPWPITALAWTGAIALLLVIGTIVVKVAL